MTADRSSRPDGTRKYDRIFKIWGGLPAKKLHAVIMWIAANV